MDSFKASRLRHQFSASSGFRQKKANAILLVFLVTISLGIFAKEYQLKWTLAGYNGEIVFTTSVNIAQKFLTIHHHFSDPSFSISSLMILNGAADANMDSFFWSLVYPPTFLSIGENNLVTIQHDGHTARTLNLFALMHSQIINPHEIDQSSIYRFPVSAGLVPIIFCQHQINVCMVQQLPALPQITTLLLFR